MLTALGALDNGYRVLIPVDCIGNRSARTEDAALARTAQAGAQITSLASVAAQLAPDFSKEPGTTILSVIWMPNFNKPKLYILTICPFHLFKPTIRARYARY